MIHIQKYQISMILLLITNRKSNSCLSSCCIGEISKERGIKISSNDCELYRSLTKSIDF